jgi:WD40 repeat protein
MFITSEFIIWNYHLQVRCNYISSFQLITVYSLDGSLAISHLDSNPITVRQLKGHEKSINCIDYCEKHKLIASGGRDKEIFIWNPFLEKSLVTLRGHNAPILKVAFNDKESQLITIASDRTMKIWDIRTNKCMQTIQQENLVSNGRQPVQQMLKQRRDFYSAAYYDQRNSTIVTASKYLNIWPVSHSATQSRINTNTE